MTRTRTSSVPSLPDGTQPQRGLYDLHVLQEIYYNTGEVAMLRATPGISTQTGNPGDAQHGLRERHGLREPPSKRLLLAASSRGSREKWKVGVKSGASAPWMHMIMQADKGNGEMASMTRSRSASPRSQRGCNGALRQKWLFSYRCFRTPAFGGKRSVHGNLAGR